MFIGVRCCKFLGWIEVEYFYIEFYVLLINWLVYWSIFFIIYIKVILNELVIYFYVQLVELLYFCYN